MGRHNTVMLAAAVLMLIAMGCTNQSHTVSTSDSSPSASASDVSKRTLTLAVRRELKSFARFTAAAAGGGSPGAGNNQVAKIAHDYLAVAENPPGIWHPRLA